MIGSGIETVNSKDSWNEVSGSRRIEYKLDIDIVNG